MRKVYIDYILGTTRWSWWALITQLMTSTSGWASTVAGSSGLKLILQVPSSASGFESSLSRVKSRKQWISLCVRWETLGLASSPVAFVSFWTKQCRSARADDPSEISAVLALSRQHLSFCLCLQEWGPPPSQWSLSRLSGMQPESWSSFPSALFTSSPDLPLLLPQCLQLWGWDSHYTGQKPVCHPPSDVVTSLPCDMLLRLCSSPCPLYLQALLVRPIRPGHPAVVYTWLWRWGQGHGTWIAALKNPSTVLVEFRTYL